MARRKPLTNVKDEVPGLRRRPDSVAAGKRDRTWDNENRAFSFRIRQVDAERLAGQASALGLSRDALSFRPNIGLTAGSPIEQHCNHAQPIE